ncbi:hypothetical protein Q3G72_013040 [Acer saccharum]|nr:hypothetical protein Q3G72_013040 [Acer saccharum]
MGNAQRKRRISLNALAAIAATTERPPFHDHAVPGRTTSDRRRRDDRVGREVRGGDRVVAASEKELREARV